MAEKNDGGDKTEKPTPKRLEDARKKGDVPKSKDVTGTVTLFVWLIVLVFGAGYAGTQLMGMFDAGFRMVADGRPFAHAASTLGWAAGYALLGITAIALIPPAIAGVLSEFLQAGGVFTTEKMKPELSKLNPVEGFKKMFSMDNLVELLKTIGKAALIVAILWLVLRGSLSDIIDSAGPLLQPGSGTGGRAAAGAVIGYTGDLLRTLLLWTFGVFLGVAVLDYAYQKHSYTKKMRMSMRDIRQEHKENEGDPLIKGQRRQLHQEWASQNAVGAARGANVLVVNPTHLAIALDYDIESCPVPVMTAKGEGPLAGAMREAAEEAGVPIIRHVPVARKLYEDGEMNEVIPRDMFDAIAQIILWAQRMKNGEVPTSANELHGGEGWTAPPTMPDSVRAAADELEAEPADGPIAGEGTR